MKNILLILSFFLLSACAGTPEKKDDRQTPSFGVKFAQDPDKEGLKIDIVFPFGAAAKAGLKRGDVLVSFNGEKPAHSNKSDVEKFVKRLKLLKLGDTVIWTVVRNKERLDFKILVQGKKFNFGDLPVDPNLQWPGLEDKAELKTELEKVSNQVGFKDDLSDLENRFMEMTTEADSFRSPAVEYLQRNPFQIQAAQKAAFKLVKKCDLRDVSGCLQRLNDHFNLQNFKVEKPRLRTGLSLREHLKQLSQLFTQLDQTVSKGFGKSSQQEVQFLKDHMLDFLDYFSENILLYEDSNQERLEKNLRALEIMLKIQPQYFAHALFQLSSALDPSFALKFKEDLKNEKTNLSKEIIAEVKTDLGLILIGGTRNNDYAKYGTKNVILILDLGGDDYYANVSGNIVDLEGDDSYESNKSSTLAGAAFNSRILLDLKGNDRYTCISHCLGASIFGSSLFIDQEGNDIYRGKIYAEAFSFAGFSAFIDGAGDDRYESMNMSQGLGIAGGKSFLIDLSGADSYFAKGLLASSYQDPGQFEGWSQGVGLGVRNFISGGIGLLYDGQGMDRFEGGILSQGGGYYFGYGLLLNDSKEDDIYIGSRYAQGFSAHYAVGSFLEVGGNDTYVRRGEAGNGLAWDLSLSLFEDISGNDKYGAGDAAIGVGLQNSFGFFKDSDGNDVYSGKHLPIQDPIKNEYHGGFSFGVFQDLGGKNDQYEIFKNNSSVVRDGHQILLDQ
jgi:hypothetical protein